MNDTQPTHTPLAALALAIGMALLISPQAGATTAGGSTFSQQIREVDCSHTVYDRAVGQVNSVECAVFALRHERTTYALNGYPTLYGVYDAAHTVIDPTTGKPTLAVEIAGRKFVLGVDPELTANGNAWTLDLSAWPATHDAGTAPVLERGKMYPIAIHTTTQAHGVAKQEDTSRGGVITIPVASASPAQPAPAHPSPSAASQPKTPQQALAAVAGATLANTGVSLWLVLLGVAGLIAGAVVALHRMKRKKQEL